MVQGIGCILEIPVIRCKKSARKDGKADVNIAVVDDSEWERAQLTDLLKQYAAQRGKELRIDAFQNARSFLAAYHPYRYTVIFMDIYMEEMDGIHAAQEIRQTDGETLLIFLTSSDAHMPQAFRYHAYDYLLKPPSVERIFAVMDEIFRKQVGPVSQLRFKFDGNDCSLPYTEIVSVLSDGHNTQITDRAGRVFTPRITFESVRTALSADGRFLLILRGVLVNMAYVVDFENGYCRLENGVCLPINVRNRSKIEQVWRNYVFCKIRERCAEGRPQT